MTTLGMTTRAVAAALLMAALALGGCEKAANGGATPVANETDSANGSTVPDLPALNKPFFSPDLVDRVGGLDLFAIEEGKLAREKAQSDDVKAFASAAIDAHTKSRAALGAVIDATGQTISLPDSLPNDLAAKLSDLQNADPAAFDKAYVSDQISAQQAAVSALETFAKHGDIPQFKTFAQNAAPVAENALATAQALQSSLK